MPLQVAAQVTLQMALLNEQTCLIFVRSNDKSRFSDWCLRVTTHRSSGSRLPLPRLGKRCTSRTKVTCVDVVRYSCSDFSVCHAGARFFFDLIGRLC